MVHPLLLIRYHSNLTLGYPFSHSQNKAHSRSLPSHITLFWRVALILIVWKWFFLKWGLAQKRKSFPDHHKVLEIMIKVGSAKSWWESVIAIMKKVWSCLKEVLLSALILIKCDHEKGALIYRSQSKKWFDLQKLPHDFDIGETFYDQVIFYFRGQFLKPEFSKDQGPTLFYQDQYQDFGDIFHFFDLVDPFTFSRALFDDQVVFTFERLFKFFSPKDQGPLIFLDRSFWLLLLIDDPFYDHD